MIHTIKYFYYPNREDYDVFSKIMKPVRVKTKDQDVSYINFHKEEHGFKIDYIGKRRLLLIRFTPPKLLNKNIITDDDYTNFIAEANKKLINYLPYIKAEDLELSQIHFKLDIYTIYKQEYINLLSKIKTNYYKNKIKIYYNKASPTIIDTVYLKNSGYNLNLYLKEREQPDKIKYKNLLRLELQIKRRKLKQILKSKYIYPKTINYFSEAKRTYFFETILKRFLYAGDYYSIRRSRNILKKHYPNKPATVIKLIEFQKLIAKHGMSKAMELLNKCDQTTREYLKLLQGAGVNPIPLDSCSADKINYLSSLFSFLYINSNKSKVQPL